MMFTVSFSPDGRRLVSVGESGSCSMLHGETEERISECGLPEMDEDVHPLDSHTW